MSTKSDIELLTKVLGYRISDYWREALEDMREKLRAGERMCLSEKQRAKVRELLEENEPQYENLISTGKAPRGREVELMVRDKPLRPPQRRSE